MSNEYVVTLGESAELVISSEIMEQIGAGAGDTIEIVVSDRALVVRSVNEAERARQIAAATRDLFDRRREAYLQLTDAN
jgi:antitoxin component of MazEF toxin-antitoxin module